MNYDHKAVEKKWKNHWEENKIFSSKVDRVKEKFYVLDMFPYPSGAGLHVGHPKGYIATDVISRYKRKKGFNVLHPMGWDAFGLPAENFAIKTGTHPKVTTEKNIQTFKRQISDIGLSYDWEREIDTTDPDYYQWTQWIFLKLFEKGLAYEAEMPINWCPSCKTGLANEEVVDGNCDRCGTSTERKNLRQWVLRITEYAERLLNDLDTLDKWPEPIKAMQRNWIGKSEGCEFEMKIYESKRGKDRLHRVGGHDGLARILTLPPHELEVAIESLLESFVKVNKKIRFTGMIEGKIEILDGILNFNSNNILKHFKTKHYKEYGRRRDLLATVFSILDQINFKNKIGHFVFKNLVIRVVLGEQKNGNLYVKSFYKHDTLTEFYQNFLKEKERDLKISVYTTRVDTVFGMTYCVLAPDHPRVFDFVTEEQRELCKNYIEEASKKSDLDRTELNKEKSGVFTGSYLINPFNGEKVPLWIGDYVLGSYGTGAVMAVPAHDERDFAFAKKYGLEIKQTIGNLIEFQGKNKAKPGVETLDRQTVDVVIENQNGEFLLLIDKNPENFHFVGGGVEEGETELEAVKREILEETGYTNFEVLGFKNLSYSIGLGFRYTKGKNQRCLGGLFHVKLDSEKRVHSEIEDGKHEMAWFKKEEVSKKLSWETHRVFWEVFQSGGKAITEDGFLFNSGDFTGLSSSEAREKLTKFAEEKGFGTKKINYKLRDWNFSRQRYWGEPIPVVHCEKCGILAEKEKNLPIKLPEVEKYEPTGTGESPLAAIDSWINCKCPKCGKDAKRETNTMPQWAGSSWYWLRFKDSKNSKEFLSKEAEDYWGSVDLYVGGAEHAVLHLLYARFWHKVLFDLGLVSTIEPFTCLKNQGLIIAEDGRKMSKSLGNVINPDEVISEYGADTLRAYEMFMGPFDESIKWDTKGIKGVKRFLDRVASLFEKVSEVQDSKELTSLLHKTIKKVGQQIEDFKFNTAISDLMVLSNEAAKANKISKDFFEKFLQILNPFAPFLTEELNEKLGKKESLVYTSWPEFDEALCVEDELTFVVQVNGKVRGDFKAPKEISKNEALTKAKEVAQKYLDGNEIKKEIFVPGKLVSFVI